MYQFLRYFKNVFTVDHVPHVPWSPTAQYQLGEKEREIRMAENWWLKEKTKQNSSKCQSVRISDTMWQMCRDLKHRGKSSVQFRYNLSVVEDKIQINRSDSSFLFPPPTMFILWLYLAQECCHSSTYMVLIVGGEINLIPVWKPCGCSSPEKAEKYLLGTFTEHRVLAIHLFWTCLLLLNINVL